MTRSSRSLLSRGGRPLGLAAVALAKGQRPGEGPWYALAPDLVNATEKALAALERERDPAVLSAALSAALGPEPAGGAPDWIGTIDRAALGELSGAPALADPPLAVRSECDGTVARGLWSLAMAFCRNPDTVAAVAGRLEPAVMGELFVRWSRLAGVTARPGEPSRLRRRLRALVAGERSGDG